jgi:hypothetical protein
MPDRENQALFHIRPVTGIQVLPKALAFPIKRSAAGQDHF